MRNICILFLLWMFGVILFTRCAHQTIETGKNTAVQAQILQEFPKLHYLNDVKHSSHLQASRFAELPHWNNSDTQGSLNAFRASCAVWQTQNPNQNVGNREVTLKVKDWLPICAQAEHVTSAQSKQFFETFFKPYHWTYKQPGHFTAYYSPVFQGSREKTKVYKIPVYAQPKKSLLTHFSRQQIYNGALQGKAKVIAWLKSPLEAMALEIEGSGIIRFGKDKVFVSYAAQNGKKYHSIAQMLINAHVLSRAKASMMNIKNYFSKHPEKMSIYVARNPSYVFFKHFSDETGVKGAQGAALTPHYSLAVDRRYVPLGVPLYLSTTAPSSVTGDYLKMHRVMVAQDVGGSIKGAVRGDIYWGAGEYATQVASLMTSPGEYWILLPRHFKLVT